MGYTNNEYEWSPTLWIFKIYLKFKIQERINDEMAGNMDER